ncbi:MAG: adenosylcobalamin-dependent ribonucleoside-diphosphate reductase [Candidatus Aenigmatarchaeota archaeon]
MDESEIKISKIRKRDGRIVDFDKNKITEAIWKAAKSVGGKDRELSEKLADQVVELLKEQLKPGEIPSVEQVQDLVEKVLIENGHAKTAKAFILYRQKRAEIRRAKALLGVQDDLKLPLNAIIVLEKRYLRKDESGRVIETPRQMFQRVAHAIAEVEKNYGKSEQEIQELESQFFEMMAKLEFLPNSPTLMNAGTGTKLNLSACFVIPVEDSIESIFEAVKIMAIVQKSGGGTGFSFSKLRPAGDIVQSTSGVASGPISFMQVFDAATEVIKQGGKRRGANMGILRVDHPDILDFIVCKEREGILKNFNISVAITDKFMDAVEKDKDFELINPRNKKPVKRIKARAIWNLIVTMAWKNGEPGVIFIDTINRHNPTPHIGEIESTNPCVAKGTLVNTPSGYVPVENIKVGDYISTVFGFEPVKAIEKHFNMPVFKVKFSDGGEQIVTASHRYYVIRKGSESKKLVDCRVDELRIGDYVRVEPTPILTSNPEEYEEGLKMGILLGDGCYTKSIISRNIVKIASNKEEVEFNENLKKLFSEENFRNVDTFPDSKTVNLIFSNGKKLLQELNLTPAYSHEKSFDIVQVRSREKALGILDGLLATDGDILLASNHPQIRFVTSSKQLAQNIRRLLLLLGCHGRIFESFSDDGGMIGKRKIVRRHPKYQVIVSGESAGRFARMSQIEKIHPIKGKKLRELKKEWLTTGNTWKARVVSIEFVGNDTVYDLYCEGSDTWITDGYVQRGCGEQPLLPFESCNLGSINLSKFVEDGKIDWKRLRETVRLAVRFLDNVIDANYYPIPQIEQMTKANRKIGLGVMGFADMLIQLGIPYNSEEALKVAEEVMKFISEEARKMSVELGEEKGSFPNFKGSVWEKKGYKAMRNATVTTIAPTGTIGVIAGCSSGIEPLFAIAYVREVSESLGANLVEINPLFETIAIKEGFYTEDLMKKISGKTSIQDVEEIPEHIRKLFVTAHDISPEWHVRMQAAFQKYTDNAVSKTINFPHHATPHDVEKAYLLAYKLGCKGITIYRHASREVQVLKPLSEASSVCPTCTLYS